MLSPKIQWRRNRKFQITIDQILNKFQNSNGQLRNRFFHYIALIYFKQIWLLELGICFLFEIRNLNFWNFRPGNRTLGMLASLILLTSYFLTSDLRAQPLDLAEALHLAKENNLQLQKQSADERIARLEEWVQKANRLPSLDLSATSTYLSEVNQIDISQTIGVPGRTIELGGHDRSELTLGIRQPIFTGFRIQSLIDLAKNTTLSEEAKFEVIANEIYYQIHALFYQAQSLYKQRAVLDASLKRLNVQLENVRNLFEAAQVMAFDTLQVYNQTLALQIEKQENALNTRVVTLQMSRLLDLTPVRPIANVAIQPPDSQPPSLDSLRQTAFSSRPEFEAVRLGQRSARLQQNLARSSYFPTILGQANYHYAKPGLDPVTNEWMDYFSVGVNLQWNLWRWQGDRRKVEEFEVLHNRFELEERELRLKIRTEVEESFEKVQVSRQQWQLSEDLRAQQAERYRIVAVQHKNGIASTNDLITAEADLTSAELQAKQALIRYYLNLADLKRAIGTIDQEVD